MAQYSIAACVETEEQLKMLKDEGLADDSVTLDSLVASEGWVGGITDAPMMFWMTEAQKLMNAGMMLMFKKEED